MLTTMTAYQPKTVAAGYRIALSDRFIIFLFFFKQIVHAQETHTRWKHKRPTHINMDHTRISKHRTSNATQIISIVIQHQTDLTAKTTMMLNLDVNDQ